MPSRWFVPVNGVNPHRVKLEFVHAAFSGWFDKATAEHAAKDKPYTVSPLTDYRGRVGVEIATLTEEAESRLWEAIESGGTVRLGSQLRPVGRAVRLHHHSWEELERDEGQSQWTLDLVTPTTFRSGDRSSPLPTLPIVLGGLSRAWNLWSQRAARTYDPRTDGAMWVSDIDLRSTVVRLEVRDRQGERQLVHLSCCLGRLTLRCDDPVSAARLAPVIRLAAYAGVGSMRGKGLGVTRVHPAATAHRVQDLEGDGIGATG